jgi:NAD(P) transhydrogenase subunit alpha
MQETGFGTNFYVFLLAAFLGLEVIRRVSPLLHTPLMSLTNAISAIAIVGSIAVTGQERSQLSVILGSIAVVASTINVVGGFLITDRMLKMFRGSDKAGAKPQAKPGAKQDGGKPAPGPGSGR